MEQEKLRLISGMCGASLLPMKTTSCRYERTGPSISPKSCGCSGQISNRCVYYISIYLSIYIYIVTDTNSKVAGAHANAHIHMRAFAHVHIHMCQCIC